MKLLKRALMVLTCVAMLLSLTACGAEYIKAADDAIAGRRSIALTHLQSLKDSGLISADVYDSMKKAMDSVDIHKFTEADAKGLLKYTREIMTEIVSDGKNLSSAGFVMGYKNENADVVDYLGAHSGAVSKEINYKVYVLKPDIMAVKSLSEINKVVKAFQEDTKSEVNIQAMNQIFNSTDIVLQAGNLFVGSKPNPDRYAIDISPAGENRPGYDILVRNPNQDKSVLLVPDETAEPDEDGNVPMRQMTEEEMRNPDGTLKENLEAAYAYCMAIRVMDFDESALNVLLTQNGISKSQYACSASANAAYLLTYPVYSVNGYSRDGDAFKPDYIMRDMYVNIATGEAMWNKEAAFHSTTPNPLAINWGGANQMYTLDSFMVIEEQTDLYLNVIDAANNKTNSVSTKAPMIVLTDFLEYTNMPGLGDNQVVALGRRIRLNKAGVTGGALNQEIATYISKDGKPIPMEGSEVDFGSLTIQDLGELATLTEDTMYKLSTESKSATPADTTDVTDTEKTETPTDTSDKSQVSSASGYEGVSVTRKYKDTIWPIAEFTSKYVNTVDSVAETGGYAAPPILYGILVDKGVFETSMFSGWINTSEESLQGSFQWWLNWLRNAGFNYTISTDALTAYLNGNYSSELRDSGIIILDLQVIGNIQREYTQEDQVARVTGFRTAFVILGMALICYGVLLLCSWAFDINIVGGPRLMTLLTFGAWEAISSIEELPNMTVGEKHYMTFGKTLKSVIIIIAIGCLLYMVDVIGLIAGLVRVIGKAADLISKTIFGN